MHMNRILPIFFLALLPFFGVGQVSQSDNPPPTKPPFKDRIYYGGDLGALFGSTTFVNVSPLVGYKITPKLSAGVGVTYQYYSFRINATERFATSIYGGQAFSRYYFNRQLYLHGEYQLLNMEVFDEIGFEVRRETVPFLYGGAGYAYPLGQRSALVGMILYDFIQSRFSPYSSPLQYRGGIVFGI